MAPKGPPDWLKGLSSLSNGGTVYTSMKQQEENKKLIGHGAGGSSVAVRVGSSGPIMLFGLLSLVQGANRAYWLHGCSFLAVWDGAGRPGGGSSCGTWHWRKISKCARLQAGRCAPLVCACPQPEGCHLPLALQAAPLTFQQQAWAEVKAVSAERAALVPRQGRVMP